MNRLLNILNEMFPNVDFEKEDKLIDHGIIDSSDVIGLITEIEDEFDVEITMEYIQPKYFNSATAMYEMIEELQD